MKLSLGMNLQAGPWGGGNQFGNSLVSYLRRHGVKVYFNLQEPDLDIILLAEPRTYLKISAYSDWHIIRYLLRQNPRALVVHRINECDERKGTSGVNRIIIRANTCADYTVFVSNWLKELLIGQGLSAKDYRVILNGSDQTIFNPEGYCSWNGTEPLKLVTHHWGGHWMKGFDIYKHLDELLALDSYRRKFSFTYIGNLPPGFLFQQATYIEPKQGQALAAAIRQHHVYLTASRNEPGSNHQNEGALCGLPLLYLESGSLPEYCQGFGISFNAENFEQKLYEMMATYDHWAKRMKDYPRTSERVGQEYYNLFTELLDRRDEFLERRAISQPYQALLRAFVLAQTGKVWYHLKRLNGLKR